MGARCHDVTLLGARGHYFAEGAAFGRDRHRGLRQEYSCRLEVACEADDISNTCSILRGFVGFIRCAEQELSKFIPAD